MITAKTYVVEVIIIHESILTLTNQIFDVSESVENQFDDDPYKPINAIKNEYLKDKQKT